MCSRITIGHFMKINLKKLDTNYLNYCILINLQVQRPWFSTRKGWLVLSCLVERWRLISRSVQPLQLCSRRTRPLWRQGWVEKATLDLSVTLRSHSNQWSWTLGSDWKEKITELKQPKWVSCAGWLGTPLKMGWKSSFTWQESTEVAHAPVSDPPWMPPP